MTARCTRLRVFPAAQAAVHLLGDEAAGQEARQPWDELVLQPRHDDGFAAHQSKIALSRDLPGRAVEASRVMHVVDSSARLEFGRYRAGAEHGDADALGLELAAQADAER